MTSIESNDNEEQSFLHHITSHLPSEWSDEQRDAFIQHVLAKRRLQREHSQQERLLLEKYLTTVKEHFRPQMPELYDFQQWPIDENLLKMIESNTLDSNVIEQIQNTGIYKFSFLPISFCLKLIEEISYFEKWCVDRGLKLSRPNSMNNYGVVLDHFGFEKCLDDLTEHIVQPLTRLVYSHVILPLDSHHGFIVEYAMDKDRKLDFHVDDSAVTLNVCLGTEFTNGELYFGGVRCIQHISTSAPKDEENVYLQHQVGTACLHLGNHRHQALPITNGRRLNMILWCHSSAFQKEIDKSRKKCQSWCGMYSDNNQ